MNAFGPAVWRLMNFDLQRGSMWYRLFDRFFVVIAQVLDAWSCDCPGLDIGCYCTRCSLHVSSDAWGATPIGHAGAALNPRAIFKFVVENPCSPVFLCFVAVPCVSQLDPATIRSNRSRQQNCNSGVHRRRRQARRAAPVKHDDGPAKWGDNIKLHQLVLQSQTHTHTLRQT